jgi:hypothetical protein
LRTPPPSLLALLTCATLLLLPSCNGEIQDDPACRGMQCLAGACRVVDGQPRCVCGAFDQALDEACDVIDVPDTDDAAGLDGANGLEAAAAESASIGGVGLLFGRPGDLADYFSFDARRTVTYQFHCSPAPCEAGFVDAELQTVGVLRRTVLGSSALFKAPADGRAYVRVRADGQPLRYTYQLASLGADDYPDTFEQRSSGQEPALTFEGHLESSLDADVIALETSSTTQWQVDCEVTGPGPRARVVDGTGRTLAVGFVWGQPPGLAFTVPAAPVAFLILEASSELRDPTKPEEPTNYRCSVKGADRTQEVRVISQVGRFSGQLDTPFEVDRYQLSLPREGVYEVRCTEASELCYDLSVSLVPDTGGTLPLRLFKAAGVPLSIYVGGRAGPYTLELVALAIDDYDAATYFPLAMDGAPVQGVFLADPADVDNFSFPVEYLGVYRIEISSSNGPLVVRPTLLPGPASDRVARFNDGAQFWIDIQSFAEGEQHLSLTGGEGNAYRVSVRRFPPDDHPDRPESAALIGPELAVQGSLYSRLDADWFLVDLEARPYTAEGITASPLVLVSLYEVSRYSPLWTSSSAATFQPPSAGRYALSVFTGVAQRDPLSYQFTLTPQP